MCRLTLALMRGPVPGGEVRRYNAAVARSREDSGAHGATAGDLRSQTRLAPRAGREPLRPPRAGDRLPSTRRAVRGTAAHRASLAGARRPHLPHRSRRGTPGRRPQRVESRQTAGPVRALPDAAARAVPVTDVRE